MRVDLSESNYNNDAAIRLTIIHLIALFGRMKYKEIIDFFPAIDEKIICSNIDGLKATNQIVHTKSYYTTTLQLKNGKGIKKREKYYECCCFIRHLLKSTDAEGYLVNDIKCVGTNLFPFAVYIVSNNNIYDIMHCSRDNISLFGQVLNHIDNTEEKNETACNRIIIVDSAEDMNYVHFRRVKYIVCRQENGYLIKAGD